MGPVTAIGIPLEFEKAYRAAARTCTGLPWTLLAAVGQVESGHGRNDGPSPAGAIGPMQFLPATFAAHAVDGDHDGTTDPWDPQDAIFTAAHYLCVSGADGGSAAGIHAALLAYNHAEWYVDLVLATQQAIVSREAGRP
jgi:membrane-bound lytic murein transglycosylase B